MTLGGDSMKVIHIIILVCFMVLLIGCGKKEQVEPVEKKITESIVTTSEATIKESIADEENTEIVITTEEAKVEKHLIAIDPGHQGPDVDMSDMEPNAPGSSEMKAKATGGTLGKYTQVPEYQLNLDISLKLRDALISEGYDVIMTREDNDKAISNAERAKFANESGADVSIRIHANGSEDTSVNGALAMVGSPGNPYVGKLYDDSYKLADAVLSSYCDTTGMKNLGVQTTDTMTGINWSSIPVMILEMGFMSNETDDKNMQNAQYQDKMVQGIINGINKYFENDDELLKEVSNDSDKEIRDILQEIADEEVAKGNSISIGFGVDDGKNNILINNKPMQSASLIKLYVAGCIYEQDEKHLLDCSPDMETLISDMIRVSDNDACNTLVKMLGNGDPDMGINKVNEYCSKHGLTDTSMGRLMLDFDSDSDNYTSVADCTAFLQSVDNGTIAGAEKILSFLKQQERKWKIPSGVPDGVITANKTGELDDVENDAAIIYTDSGTYVLVIMMSDLNDTSSAQRTIKEISSRVYELRQK